VFYVLMSTFRQVAASRCGETAALVVVVVVVTNFPLQDGHVCTGDDKKEIQGLYSADDSSQTQHNHGF
jgi:hypothetical protein